MTEPVDFMPYVSWGIERQSIEIPKNQKRCIDLNQEVSLRVYVREGKERTHLILQVHHCHVHCLDKIKIDKKMKALIFDKFCTSYAF